MNQSELIAIELKRRKLYKQFKRDVKKAVIGYVKELYPKTWFFKLLFSLAWLDQSWVDYFKYTEIWMEEDHWFFKKWGVGRRHWHGEYYGYLKEDPSIRFDFCAWLCFRSGF